jgi:hypothetical protein
MDDSRPVTLRREDDGLDNPGINLLCDDHYPDYPELAELCEKNGTPLVVISLKDYVEFCRQMRFSQPDWQPQLLNEVRNDQGCRGFLFNNLVVIWETDAETMSDYAVVNALMETGFLPIEVCSACGQEKPRIHRTGNVNFQDPRGENGNRLGRYR